MALTTLDLSLGFKLTDMVLSNFFMPIKAVLNPLHLGGHIGTKIYASWRTFWCFLNLLLLDVDGGHIMNLCDASHKMKSCQYAW